MLLNLCRRFTIPLLLVRVTFHGSELAQVFELAHVFAGMATFLVIQNYATSLVQLLRRWASDVKVPLGDVS